MILINVAYTLRNTEHPCGIQTEGIVHISLLYAAIVEVDSIRQYGLWRARSRRRYLIVELVDASHS